MASFTKSVRQSRHTITRPGNTAAYAAGEVVDLAVGEGLTFTNCAPAFNHGGRITSAILVDNANVVTPLDSELWLLNAPFAAYDNDQQVFTPTDADLQDSFVGVLQFATGSAFRGDASAGAAGNLAIMAAQTFLPISFVCSGTSRSLFGVLVARNAYIPVSGEEITIILNIEN